MAKLVSSASLPPRNITALPDLKHSAPASAVTLGRASYIMHTTPSGIRIFLISIPFGRVPITRSLPTGSSSSTITSMPSAIDSIRSSFRIKRSTIAASKLFSLARATSFSFTSIILLLFARIAAAISVNTAFFWLSLKIASVRAAFFACCANSVIMLILSPDLLCADQK